MATILNQNLPSLIDLVKAGDYFPDDMKKFLGELALEDSFTASCPFFPTSHGMIHKDSKASILGKGEFVAANAGRGTTSSDFKTNEDSICFYSIISQVDDVVLKSGTKEQAMRLRMEQDQLNLAGFTQSFTEKWFYGSKVLDPNGFDGFAARRNDEASDFFFSGGKTTGDLTSVYIMQFGKDGVNARYNPANPSGIYQVDRGKHSYSELINGQKRIIDYWEREFNIWSLPIVFDERTLIRYGNLDPKSTLSVNTFIEMRGKLPKRGKNAAAFLNRSLLTQAELALIDKSNIQYKRTEIENYGEVMHFGGLPLLLQDCISDKETLVS